MKKYFLILLSVLGTLFLNSCATDGDWEDGNNGGVFGFTIERDETFIEKGLGEVNQLKFNIIPNYDFNTVQTTFKFTTSLNGSLKLNGQNLVANQEYTFTSKENIFEYVGNVSGTHDLKFTVKNAKGASKEEVFELPYSISEFTHTFTGGSADIYQGDGTNYLMKIVPGAAQPTSGYEIKFVDYNTNNGTVKLNGVDAQLGQFYPLPNIDNFNIILTTNQVGQGSLQYTIKNSTVSKDYNIQQTILPRQIVVESMNINSTAVLPNTQMSLIGVVKKAPVTPNLSVSYKTWISSASNNNMSGIQNTNNIYVPYALTSTGSFTYNFNAIDPGTYTYNIQFKDEYGNESAVKSFTVEVQSPLQFVGTPSGSFTLSRQFLVTGPGGNGPNWRVRYKEYMKNFKVVAGGGTTITQIKYEYKFTFNQTPLVLNFEENFNGGNSTVEQINQTTTQNQIMSSNNFSDIAVNTPIQDGTLKITAFASNGNSISQTVSIPVNMVMY
ncbi:hypothetical protein [Chryseobacterium sp. 5_R23647]|uniref:hypothetical protein n=1 Tax=Chryseobacterium sp. 5_R23647 TaxID=2258964 RepID=UPI000E239DA8|nr:hypothetical protein [Chryseobacterium sp. 5_R23647]REC39844.1 hypothetical protein DRF69_21275 [Chryseobacterium sp. 5_R23647]